MNGEIVVVDDLPGAFAEAVADAFTKRKEETFAMALSGGETAKACYERLAQDGHDKIDWWSVEFYWGDERCVDPTDPASNQLLGRKALLERVGAASAVYPMHCEEGTDSYQVRVAEVGKLDLVHLGMGADGHTASLFPYSPALDAEPGRLVAFNEDPRGNNPHRRMTLTFEAINRSRLAIFTVAGESKAEALRAVVDGVDLPAGHVAAQEVIWLVDRPAARWL